MIVDRTYRCQTWAKRDYPAEGAFVEGGWNPHVFLNHSYIMKDIAMDGTTFKKHGIIPLYNEPTPSVLMIVLTQSTVPLYLGKSTPVVPCNCILLLMRSVGYVIPAAQNPAHAPSPKFTSAKYGWSRSGK